VPHGSPGEWWWQERNEWGFEGWVPDQVDVDEGDHLNDFTIVYDFGEGMRIEVSPAGYDGDALSWVVPAMSRAELEQWLSANTPAFDLQAERDEFFSWMLEDFVKSENRPEGSLLFKFSDYDGHDIIEVLILPDNSFAAWSPQHQSTLWFKDLCRLRRVYDDKLERHWTPTRMDPKWERRWEDCAGTSRGGAATGD
jgi:hypothetical protein